MTRMYSRFIVIPLFATLLSAFLFQVVFGQQAKLLSTTSTRLLRIASHASYSSYKLFEIANPQNGSMKAAVGKNLTQLSNSSASSSPSGLPSRSIPSLAPINKNIPNTPSYPNHTTIVVSPTKNSSAVVYCRAGDPMVSGGYSIGYKSIQSFPNTVLYSNGPTERDVPATSSTTSNLNNPPKLTSQEGWKAGLINEGRDMVTITAWVLCVNTLH